MLEPIYILNGGRAFCGFSFGNNSHVDTESPVAEITSKTLDGIGALSGLINLDRVLISQNIGDFWVSAISMGEPLGLILVKFQ